MTVEQLTEKRATLLATAREMASSESGDMAQVKTLMAEAESLAGRIDAIKSLGEMAPKPNPVPATEEPWKSGGVVKNPFTGSREEASLKAYTFGQLARALMGNAKSSKWLAEKGIKAQIEGTNNLGGFTVPDPLSSDLIYLREQFGAARRYCRIYPMVSDTQLVPNATASTTVYYPGENTAITPSDVTFAQVSLSAKKMAILTLVSKELNEDSVIDLGSMLARDMAYVIAREEDRAVFVGVQTGADASGLTSIPRALSGLTGDPVVPANLGNVAGIVVGAAGTGTVGNNFAGFTLANLQNMVGRLQTYADNPVWFMSKQFFYNGVADKLINLNGNNIDAIQNAYGPNPSLFGYPVVFVQTMAKTPAINTPVAILGDLSKATAFGDRRGLTIELSDQRYFVEDSLAFKATERFAFNAFDIGNIDATPANRVAGSVVALFTATT